jgi:serine/threonine protein kinase
MAYFKDIVAGFSLLAESSVLHRDLKPANVFLSQNSCKIADFGFAKKNTSPGQR